MYDSNGDVIATTTTIDNGNYVFDNTCWRLYGSSWFEIPDGTNPKHTYKCSVTLTQVRNYHHR
ncbi:MAG: hypothetical protein IPN94_23015 [Sphingobacteriales bacterium]|nr:hypothetical protein [Sphingobacteriales bacterium]